MRSTSNFSQFSLFILCLLFATNLVAQPDKTIKPPTKPVPSSTLSGVKANTPVQTRSGQPSNKNNSALTNTADNNNNNNSSSVNNTSANNGEVLFTIGGQPVYLSEFAYVYNKNNVDDKNGYTKESLNDYLDLYIKFRLKVKEAENLGMDTLSSLSVELETYRKQLSKQYLYDREVSEKLLEEAYERSKLEVNASHILIGIDEPGLPADTLKAYKPPCSCATGYWKVKILPN